MFRKFLDKLRKGRKITAGLDKYLALMPRDLRDTYRSALQTHPEIAKQVMSTISKRFSAESMNDDERLQIAMEVLKSEYDRIKKVAN